MEDYSTPPQAAEFVIADPPLEVDPAAGTGALPPIDEEAKPRKYEHMPRRVAVGILLGIMATKDCTVDEVDALSLGINALVRRCRHSAKNWARRREHENENGEDNGQNA